MQGRIGEEIQGKLKLWVQQSSEGLSCDAESDSIGLNSETENLTSETKILKIETENLTSETAIAPKPASDGHSEDSSDLLINSSTNLSHSHPPDNPEREILDAQGKPIQAFSEWLLRRANELPAKPVLMMKWVNTQVKDPDIQEEFFRFYKSSKMIHVPLPAKPPEKLQPELQEMTQQARLEKYLTLWQTPILKRTVAEQIQAHPDWGLTLTDEGPTLVGERS